MKLPRWMRVCLAWRTVREAGVYAYQQNDVSGSRRIIRLNTGCHSPMDLAWVKTGRFAEPPRPPGPKPLRRPGELPAHVSIFPHFNVYAPTPRKKEPAMTHTNVQVPSYGEVSERQNFNQIVAERDFWKREAERAHEELRNIPEAVEKYGFVEFSRRDGNLRLVQQASDAEA